MAHFAGIDKNNIVVKTIVIKNEEEHVGAEICENLEKDINPDTPIVKWLQTSYNTNMGEHLLGGTPLRGNYAEVGYLYDDSLDAFLPPKPFDSWLLNEQKYFWEPPVPRPSDDLAIAPSDLTDISGWKFYDWDEQSLSWVEVTAESE